MMTGSHAVARCHWKRWVCWVAFLGTWLTGAEMVVAHPHAVSSGKARWIEETRSLEVELRVSAVDLEVILSEKAGHDVLFAGDKKKAEALLKGYVLEHCQATHDDGTEMETRWLGYEIEGDDAWIYFEIGVGRPTMTGGRMKNTLLMETFPNQINLINVMQETRRHTLTFRRRTPVLPLPNW